MGTVSKWLRSANCYVYCNHFLSAWGARMWRFAVGLFFIRISPDSLQLSAIYGLATGATVLVFAPIVGDWVDKNQRLRAARVMLVIQYINMMSFAVLVCLLVKYYDWAVLIWDGWLLGIWQAAIIAVAVLANLATLGYRISVQRDWVVEICARDKNQLATMAAVLRRIDLANKILAPIATGQIMTFASILIGGVFIACWNFVSMFVEYYLLWKVYKSVPALASKETRSVSQVSTGQKDKGKGSKLKDKSPHVELEALPTTFHPGTTEYTFRSRTEPETCAPSSTKEAGDGKCPESSALDSSNREEASGKKSVDTTNEKTDVKQPQSEAKLKDDGQIALKQKQDGSKGDNSNGPVGDPAAPNGCHKGGLCYKLCGGFVILYNGWKTYIRHKVSRAGLGLACLYLTVLGFDNITTGYAYSQGLSESILGFLMASGALIGIVGTFAFTRIRRRVGLERTGLVSFSAQILCLTLCVGSIWAPGSPFDPLHWREKQKVTPICNTTDQSTFTSLQTTPFSIENHFSFGQSNSTTHRGTFVTGSDVNVTEVVICPDDPVRSYASVALLLTGIITARFGLWITDLTITQAFLENLAESERGVVNGVQTSLNQLMDMLKFALVVAAPQLELFGILVIISFLAVSTGGGFYVSYCRKIRGHFFHPEKFKCPAVSSGNRHSSKEDGVECRRVRPIAV